MDRLDVAYTKFISVSKQSAVVETLLPFCATQRLQASARGGGSRRKRQLGLRIPAIGESILEEVVPASFRVKLVQVLPRCGRERANRSNGRDEECNRKCRRHHQATVTTYNRARQSKITQEIMEIIGGVEALEG